MRLALELAQDLGGQTDEEAGLEQKAAAASATQLLAFGAERGVLNAEQLRPRPARGADRDLERPDAVRRKRGDDRPVSSRLVPRALSQLYVFVRSERPAAITSRT